MSICRPRPPPLFNNRVLMKDTAGLASGAVYVPVAFAGVGINLMVIGGKLPFASHLHGRDFFF